MIARSTDFRPAPGQAFRQDTALRGPAWPAGPWALAARAAQAGFDALRLQHAAAVRAGMIPASLRGSARFEQWLDTLERASLGPLARRV